MIALKARQILGVKFKVGSGPQVVAEAVATGGLVVVPSAPVLVGIAEDPALRDAVVGADMAITDSGLMVLLWKLLTGEKLERVSGLEYLKLLLARSELKAPGSIFWVMPTPASEARNLAWLQSEGFPVTDDDCYIAPMYAVGVIRDEVLLAKVRARRPNHVILCLGGGVQERIGYFLRNELRDGKTKELKAENLKCEDGKARNLKPEEVESEELKAEELKLENLKPLAPLLDASSPVFVPDSREAKSGQTIHCIGAAIGFLTGDQVRIPMWVDHLYLGWFWRICSAPTKFFPRYWKSIKLIGLMAKYRERAPVI